MGSAGDEVTVFQRLQIPSGRHPLEGLWKGTFGGHGVEIVTFEAVDTHAGPELWARKVEIALLLSCLGGAG